jgi:hypothetical protein
MVLHLDNNNKNSSNSRKTKWLIGVPAIAVIGVILIIYISTSYFGSSPSSVSKIYLSNTPKLISVAPGVAAQQSNNG